ncbi:hypothetical protein O3M35_008096 [Rhynocoris fuscipes]|uniref:Uncharacterized protein n=1 Tax=Rhynocoris fuscipes TaxID=488301 RepID=A0AAW1DCM5_9HEMI
MAKADGHSDSESDASVEGYFLTRGAFLLTPSHDLNMDKAASILDKMNFKGPFSLTKTATGILFKFADPEDYQATFKKGFHKVTGARFYKKVSLFQVPIPCRPQKTFVVLVLDVPEDLPEEDIRHSLYKFQSVVEVTRLHSSPINTITDKQAAAGGI